MTTGVNMLDTNSPKRLQTAYAVGFTDGLEFAASAIDNVPTNSHADGILLRDTLAKILRAITVAPIPNIKALRSEWDVMTPDERARYFAIELGRKGGQSKSRAKQEAAKKNGKKGGRPKRKISQVVASP